jgi:hypothetical protein
MRAAHVLDQAPFRGAAARRGSRPLAGLAARLRAPSLDRQLASGVPSWCCPRHAARALQLTSMRRRCTAARSLEALIERSEERPPRGRSAAIPPCREQVRDALPEIMAITARLRSTEPVAARGVAMLRELLGDGCGPCFISSHPAALTEALDQVSRWLSAAS